jgi:hypothetical protein
VLAVIGVLREHAGAALSRSGEAGDEDEAAGCEKMSMPQNAEEAGEM